MDDITQPQGTTRATAEFDVATPRKQNARRAEFPGGVTYHRPNGGTPGSIEVAGAGFLSPGVTRTLIQGLAGALDAYTKDQESGSMGETPENMRHEPTATEKAQRIADDMNEKAADRADAVDTPPGVEHKGGHTAEEVHEAAIRRVGRITHAEFSDGRS